MKKYLLSEAKLYDQELILLNEQKLLITTLNAHCFNLAQEDEFYNEVLRNSDILLPDGISIILSKAFLTGEKLKKIAGADLFYYEMDKLNQSGGSCFFLGSNQSTLTRIIDRTHLDYPKVEVFVHSPPYKHEFSETENDYIIDIINKCKPDVLFIGMTAPKQEKWAYMHLDRLNTGHICCIGAVFDFYAGTIRRAPGWIIRLGMEWFFRFLHEPVRLWSRYMTGNLKFISLIIKEKISAWEKR